MTKPITVPNPLELLELPIGTQDFQKLRTCNMLYVDKTRQIYDIARLNAPFFLARPRRFGKSLLCSTLDYLFRGKRELFKGLWIDQSNWEWKTHPVIHLNMSDLQHQTVAILENSIANELIKIGLEYGVTVQREIVGDMFRKLIIALATIAPVVLIIDEYDKAMINQLHDIAVLNEFRAFFKAFYGSLKGCDQHLRLLFITGVTQFSMVSIFSDINHLNKLTLSESAATLCGYTQQELELTFAPYILRAEATEQLSHDEFLAKIKHWYNGYCFTKPQTHLPRVYNPFSILKFLYDKSFENYWFTTGTPTFVLNLLEQHTFNVPDFEHVKAVSDELENFTPAEPELTTMLYQTGYLTIQSYDAARRTYILGFPNFEVAASCSEQLLKRIVKLKGSDVRDAGLELREVIIENYIAP